MDQGLSLRGDLENWASVDLGSVLSPPHPSPVCSCDPQTRLCVAQSGYRSRWMQQQSQHRHGNIPVSPRLAAVFMTGEKTTPSAAVPLGPGRRWLAAPLGQPLLRPSGAAPIPFVR
ncbi:unnamed protein product [Merluccius merluccius]